MSLEELINIEVSTVMRVPEPTTMVPAAVYVITHEDIRRSGATTLPEVLRMAPGVQVARLDSSRYAIGIRGFADRLARSMLVLMDGRAVYSPLFAGTYWEVQDTLLADIDRIEIIRGPGGTLWGANAVNGIINIITRRARDSQGLLVTARAGSEPQAELGVRYGGSVGPAFHYRAYARGFQRDAQFHPVSLDYDDWRLVQAGFRGDWTLPQSRTFTLQGDLYGARVGQRAATTSYAPPFTQVSSREAPVSGANALARWSGPLRAGTQFQLQTYYDRTSRDEIPVAEDRDTLDVDFQLRARWRDRHDLVWGLGYRVSSGRITAIPPTAFSPPSRTDQLITGFIQDDVTLVPERWRLALGTKLEHNDYSGVEIQPSVRLVWMPNQSSTLVWSVTRAVRTPSRVETDYTTASVVNPAVPSFVRLLPNPEFRAEELVAYEAGYRVRPHPTVYITASGFFNQLENTLSTDLLTSFVETSPPPPRLILPVTFSNGLHGNSHGVEVTGEVRPRSWLRLTGNYSFLRVQVTRNPGSTDVSQERRYETGSPQHQMELRSSLDLPRSVSFDWFLRYVSELGFGPVPAYTSSNIRVAWQVAPQFELSVVGQDLHAARHLEFPGGNNVLIQRGGYVGLTWMPAGR